MPSCGTVSGPSRFRLLHTHYCYLLLSSWSHRGNLSREQASWAAQRVKAHTLEVDFTGEGCQDWILGLDSFWRKEEANGHSAFGLHALPLLFPLSTAINHPWFVASARTIFMLCPHNSFHSLPYFVSITSPSTCFPLPLGSQGLLLLAPLHARGLWKCQKHQGVLQPSTPSSCSKSVKLKEKLTTTATLFLFFFNFRAYSAFSSSNKMQKLGTVLPSSPVPSKRCSCQTSLLSSPAI